MGVDSVCTVYMEVSKVYVEQEDTHMGVRSEDKKKAFTYLLAYWVLAKVWVWVRVRKVPSNLHLLRPSAEEAWAWEGWRLTEGWN